MRPLRLVILVTESLVIGHDGLHERRSCEIHQEISITNREGSKQVAEDTTCHAACI